MSEKENEISNSNELMSLSQSFDSKQYIRDITFAIKNGEISALGGYTVLKRFQKIAEEVFKDKEIKDLALAEAEKYLVGNNKSVELWSAKITKAATYTYYDFSECNHPVLDELYKIKKEVEESIKSIEEELKLLIKPEGKQTELGIGLDTKQIIVEKMPFLQWIENEDQVTVQAPKKIQQIGLKYMKI